LVVKPSSATPTATEWELRLSSSQLSNVPKTVHLRYADAVDPAAGPTYQTITVPDPAFIGTGYVQIDTPTLGTLSVPVKARAWNNKLVVYDETLQLSPSGKLVLVAGTSFLDL